MYTAPSEDSIRRRTFDLLEHVDRRSPWPKVIAGVLVTLVLVNVFAAIFETVPSLELKYAELFRAIETISLVVFAVEYVVRLWASVEHPRARGRATWRARLSYALSPAALVDLLAIAPFFVDVLTDVHLRVIVMIRLLRLFKLARYSTGFQSLFEAFRRERHALVASFLILVSVILVSASFAYMAEHEVQPEAFGSIPAAIWWSLETLTTVGYGDEIPRTVLGRIVGGVTMISGILMIALPVAILGSAFTEVVRQRSFVITFGMVARIPMFADIGPQALGEMLPHLHAQTIEAGTVIVEPERGDESLYVIAEGTVEVDYSHARTRLGPNDAFGAAPDPESPAGHYSALALSRVKLLSLDRTELRHLATRFPELSDRMRPAILRPSAPAAG